MTKRQLRKQLKEFSHKTEPSTTLYSGALGIYIGGHQYVDVPNRPGFVYVRLRNNTSELIQAHNEVVSPVYGLPVILVRNKTYYEIYGRDSVQYASYWDSSSSYLPKHGHQHEFDPDNNGGGDLVFVHGEQFYPMMTFPSGTDGGNTVLIAPYRYYYSSAWHYAGDTGAGNLLQYGPTGANNAKLLLVGIDATTGNPFVKLGSEFDASITGAAAMTSYVPTNITQSTEIPGAIVRLVTGTATITWANIYDARQYMGILQAGASTFLSLSDTPNSYAGQADKLLVVNAAENAVEFRTNTGSFGGGGGTAIWGALVGSQVDDWSLPGFAGASIINAYASGTSSVILTGLAGGTAGKQITLKNNSGIGTIVLWNNNSSLFQNQFYLPKTYMSLGPGDSISLIYDADYQNWYPLDATLGFSNDLYFKSWATLGLNSGTTNDWNNFNFAENSIIRVMPSGTATLTGILQFNSYPQGQLITLVNIGSFNVTLKNEDSGSTTHARFSLPNDIVLSPKGSIVLIYDGEYSVSTSRWRSLDYSTTGSNSGGGGTTLGLGFYGQDEGVGLGTGTTLNVVGSDISLSISGTVLTLLHSDPTGTPHNFLDLTDTPDSYLGQGSKYVAVNTGGTALEFVAAPAGGGGGGSGLVVYDDSVYKVTGTAISFDSNLSVAVTGSITFVSESKSMFGYAPLTPPPSTGWTWDNSGTSSIDSTYGYEYGVFKAAGGIQMRGRYRTSANAHYSIEVCFSYLTSAAAGTNYARLIGFRDSGGKIVALLFQNSGGTYQLQNSKWNSSTSYSTTYKTQAGGNIIAVFSNPVWARIDYDGTNIICYYGIDGYHWIQYDTQLLTNFLTTGTPNPIWGAYCNDVDVNIALLSWKETALP